MPARAMAKPSLDNNNLTNQLATILHESFGIEPKDWGRVYQKPNLDYYDQLPYPRGYRVPEFSKFRLPHLTCNTPGVTVGTTVPL
jgi:hypothetical protein